MFKYIIRENNGINYIVISVICVLNQVSLSSSACCWGTGLPYELHIRRTGHNPPRVPSAGWWVLTTANAAGTNGLTCLPKHRGARDNKFFTYPMTDQRCLTSTIARRSAPRVIELLETKYVTL
jgi:hypothetical protein